MGRVPFKHRARDCSVPRHEELSSQVTAPTAPSLQLFDAKKVSRITGPAPTYVSPTNGRGFDHYIYLGPLPEMCVMLDMGGAPCQL